MGRSFGVARTIRKGTVWHEPSGQRFTISYSNPNQPHIRRSQPQPDGSETNAFETDIQYFFGSGNHAQSYVSQGRNGELVQLPVTWYGERGGYWAMSPAYDRPDHSGFSRKISYRCMFCHNAYPDVPAGSDLWEGETRFAAPPPQGIDCQRCHGPGAAHVAAARAGRAAPEIRASVVNPARLSRERQLEVCLQCHLETTALRLPASIMRFGRGVFSYRPGEPLAGYQLHFDHAPGAGNEDKFEFSSAPYRMRKSACFIASKGALGCTTCHDPHAVPDSNRANTACARCHAGVAKTVSHPAGRNCVSCHMAERRPSDAIRVTIRDHLISRRPSPNPPVTQERHDYNTPPYRGEVALYYPPDLSDPADELYLAVAQIKDGSNLTKGLSRLEAAISRFQPEQAAFYYELGQGYSAAGHVGKAAFAHERAREMAPGDWRFLYAVDDTPALQKAWAIAPRQLPVLLGLGEAFVSAGRIPDGVDMFRRAVALDQDSADAHNNLAAALARRGDLVAAEASMRESVRLSPEVAQSRVNLGELLMRRKAVTEARIHFESAVRSDPRLAPAHNNLGAALLVLGEVEKAIASFEAALVVHPRYPVARVNLAEALMRQGRLDDAERQVRQAIQDAPGYSAARVKLTVILQRKETRQK